MHCPNRIYPATSRRSQAGPFAAASSVASFRRGGGSHRKNTKATDMTRSGPAHSSGTPDIKVSSSLGGGITTFAPRFPNPNPIPPKSQLPRSVVLLSSI